MKMSELKKLAQFSDDSYDYDNEEEDNDVQATPHGGMMNVGPTLGTLEHAILTEWRMTEFEKRYALQRLQQETRFAPPSTPLRNVLGMLGGGVLGAMVARIIGLGGMGMGIAAIGGAGLGKVIADFYLNQSSNRNKIAIR